MAKDIIEACDLLESLNGAIELFIFFLFMNQYKERFGIPEDKSEPIIDLTIDIRFDSTRSKEVLRQIAKIEEKQNHLDQISIIEDLYQKLSDVEEKTNKMHNRRLTYISK